MKPSNLLSVSVLFFAHLALSRPAQEVLATSEALEHDDNTISQNLTFLPPGGADWTFPFQRGNPAYTNPSTFVTNLYRGNGDQMPWLNHTDARDPDIHPWMIKYLGNPQLTAATGEPVNDRRNPNWRWAEMWRPLVVYKTLLSTRAASANGDGHAVTEYLNNLGNDPLSHALFPPDVRTLLINNERIIADPSRTLPWVGHPSNKGPLEPYKGIQITSGLGMRFGQECPVGPLSIEASFILATQLAGINWKTLNSQLNEDAKLAGVYWMNAIIPYDKQDNHIEEHRTGGHYHNRDFGYLSRRGAPVTGSPDGGFSLVLDIDAKIDGSDKNKKKNLFIFAVHSMDPHSRIYFQYPDRLHQMTYRKPYDVKKWKDNYDPIGNSGANVRFYAHGHGAIMDSKVFEGWFGQNIPKGKPGEKMPHYSQIGSMHLYFLPEDENTVWPRQAYITHDRAHENPSWVEPGV